MEMQEYECNQCKAKFAKHENCCSETNPEVKCPECGSTDVEKSSSRESIL
jgi:putative FmdB family regulatory protein